GSVSHQFDVDASERSVLVHAYRRAEGRAGVLREGDEHVPLVVWRREPCDRYVTVDRTQRGTVDRAAVEMPSIVVDRHRLGPRLVDQARDDNVACLVVGAIAIGDDRAGRSDGNGGRTTIADAGVHGVL